MADRLRGFGTDRGGLRVEVEGGRQQRVWCLLAEGGDGPYVPAVPAAALVRKLAQGGLSWRGAAPCLGLLTLAEIERAWSGLRIASGWQPAYAPSLYRRALGEAYERMSAPGRSLHYAGTSIWRGRCAVDGPANVIGRFVAALLQLPPATADAPISVEFTASDGAETWTRRVGYRTMRSRQFIGRRRPMGWIVEQFGPFAFDLAVPIADGRLELVVRGARFLGAPLPRFLWPGVKASETGEGERFRFDVEIGLPLIGRLVRYRGSLTDR